MSFFETIYSWFSSLFREPLAQHLAGYGYDPATDTYDYFNSNSFNLCGIIALVSAVFICVTFYYIWNPAYGKRWKWFLMLGSVTVINLVVGWAIPYSDLINEVINVGKEGMNVTNTDCVMFGISNLLVSACFFIIISYIIKWWSNGNKYIPF